MLINVSLLIGAVTSCIAGNHEEKKPNILLLIADDLRPELGCYGIDKIQTPHIDSLANQSVLFNNAYCNIPVSGASRASFLTGMYPNYPNRFTSFDARADEDCPEAIPISKWFVDNGYYAISNGKVFHNIADHADSWSEYPWRVNPDGYGSDWAVFNKWELWLNEDSKRFINPKTERGPFCESPDVADQAYDDGKATLKTIKDLQRLKDMQKPFFLACGFWRPHLPFNAPKRYWDLYDRDSIPLASNFFLPDELPKEVRPSTEIKGYGKVDLDDIDFRKEAKHGYWASVSYIDAQIGLILEELKRLELSDNTIVILLGDHGWHLGEHTFWGKHNLMNNATRVPLIVYVPKGIKGKQEQVVELVDLYPTLCQLANIPYPLEQLEGESFKHFLTGDKHRTKDKAFIQWERGKNVVDQTYSYSEWKKEGAITSRMLYDRKNDPLENKNLILQADTSVINQYSQWINKKN